MFLIQIGLILASAASIHTATADGDKIAERLRQAEASFTDSLDDAKTALVAAYKTAIADSATSSKIENVTRLTAGLQLFESDGSLMEPELETAYKEYGTACHTARETLLTAYRSAIVELAAEGRTGDIQAIQQSIFDHGLISKLVLIQLTSRPTLRIMHENYKGVVRQVPPHFRLNATFEMVVGLSTEGIVRESAAKSGIQGRPFEIVSFRSANVSGHYLAHGNHELAGLTQRADEQRGRLTWHHTSGRRDTGRGEIFNLRPERFQGHPVRSDGSMLHTRTNAS